MCFRAADLYLAELACTANRPDRALAHFEAALRINRAMCAWPSLARTLFRYGTYLMSQPSDGQQALGLQQLREAEQLARRLEMTALVADIEASPQLSVEEFTADGRSDSKGTQVPVFSGISVIAE